MDDWLDKITDDDIEQAKDYMQRRGKTLSGIENPGGVWRGDKVNEYATENPHDSELFAEVCAAVASARQDYDGNKGAWRSFLDRRVESRCRDAIRSTKKIGGSFDCLLGLSGSSNKDDEQISYAKIVARDPDTCREVWHCFDSDTGEETIVAAGKPAPDGLYPANKVAPVVGANPGSAVYWAKKWLRQNNRVQRIKEVRSEDRKSDEYDLIAATATTRESASVLVANMANYESMNPAGSFHRARVDPYAPYRLRPEYIPPLWIEPSTDPSRHPQTRRFADVGLPSPPHSPFKTKNLENFPSDRRFSL